MKINRTDNYFCKENDFGREKKGNRNFGYRENTKDREKGKNFSTAYDYDNYNTEKQKFKLKNSLIITPFYEVEFEVGGGIRYVKNHTNEVLVVGDRFNIFLNDTKKVPILEKREMKKYIDEKKIVIEEEYNFDDLFLIYHNISLFYDKNKIDVSIRFKNLHSLNNQTNDKQTLNSISTNYSIPEVSNVVRYRNFISNSDNQKYNTALSKENINALSCKWINFECQNSLVKLSFNKKTRVNFRNKYLSIYLNKESIYDKNGFFEFSFIFSDKPFDETKCEEPY